MDKKVGMAAGARPRLPHRRNCDARCIGYELGFAGPCTGLDAAPGELQAFPSDLRRIRRASASFSHEHAWWDRQGLVSELCTTGAEFDVVSEHLYGQGVHQGSSSCLAHGSLPGDRRDACGAAASSEHLHDAGGRLRHTDRGSSSRSVPPAAVLADRGPRWRDGWL